MNTDALSYAPAIAEAAIRQVAVIGAGSMGSGIAAQFANAGIPVRLLDVPGAAGARSGPAEAGIARQRAAGGFMHPERAALVTPGNVEDDLAALAEADWILEAVVEDLAVKRALFARLARVARPDAIVSSNTSTIRLAAMTEGMAPDLAGAFLITHFFNPPRHLRLVEIVTGPATRPEIAARARLAADVHLGKTPVACRDTPGFIANRIGCYWIAAAALEALRLGLAVEEADALAGAPFGIPRTGVFGLLDLIGIDLVPLVWGSLAGALPATDAIHQADIARHPLFTRMIEAGRIGRKSGGGFYRRGKAGREALDLAGFDYRPEAATDVPRTDLAGLYARDDAAGIFVRRVLDALVAYACACGPEIAEDVDAIDTAMRLGYNWARGPFELADLVGAGRIAESIAAGGMPVPPLLARAAAEGGFRRGGEAMLTEGGWSTPRTPAGIVRMAALREARREVWSRDVASLRDAGNGVACLEMHGKLNVLDGAMFDALNAARGSVTEGFAALVIASGNPRAFSAGANLRAVLACIEASDWPALEALVLRGQTSLRALRAAPFPVVAAASGFAVGGGCELLLHCHHVVADAELAAGLPEAKVGLLPAWGGCLHLLARRGDAPEVFGMIARGAVSDSALRAREMGVLTVADTIVMNPDRVLAAAIARAASGDVARPATPVPPHAGFTAPEPASEPSETDRFIAETLAGVLNAAGAGEEAGYAAERDALLTLARRPQTRARIEHMLATGKPLRN